MTTFSWMLFLAVLLYLTLVTVCEHLNNLINKEEIKPFEFVTGFLACFGWSYWYMYFLN